MAGGREKVTDAHLDRLGYVYIRQSTQYQVDNNRESTLRQYDMAARLQGLGWPPDRIVTIDEDLGVSGRTGERSGFQRVMGDVVNGKVGAIASLEASRLSRSSSDWARLTDVCLMSGTLIVDAEGVYDPGDFNDSLVLGLKGTISAAELHFLQERMRGGLINKAQRGELRRYLPIGYEYDADGNVGKSPDERVRDAIDLFFSTFRRLGAAHQVVRYFDEHDILFPCRLRKRNRPDEVIWEPLDQEKAVSILHNPFYAGRYVFGRTQMQWVNGARRPVAMPEEKWHANIRDHHEAYVSEEEYAANQEILAQNTQQFRSDGDNERKSAPREGDCLLQGIAYCGRCGCKMGVRYGYNQRTKTHVPRYHCDDRRHAGPGGCRVIVAAGPVDERVAEIVSSRLTPEALALTSEIHAEVCERKREVLKYWESRLETARAEEETARYRYLRADPTNRFVIPALEADWNDKMRSLAEAQEKYDEEVARAEAAGADEVAEFVRRITSLGDDLAEAWGNPALSNADKKRLVRCIIEDVVILRSETEYSARLQIRYTGGATEEVDVKLVEPRYVRIATPRPVIEFLERESWHHPYTTLADMLNEQGYTRACKRPFRPKNVHRIMKDYGIPSMKQHYLDAGWLTAYDMAERLGIGARGLMYRVHHGIYQGATVVVEDRGTTLFYPDPDATDVPLPGQGDDVGGRGDGDAPASP